MMRIADSYLYAVFGTTYKEYLLGNGRRIRLRKDREMANDRQPSSELMRSDGIRKTGLGIPWAPEC